MATSILTKKDAKQQFEKLGIVVNENDIQIGRFFLLDQLNSSRVHASPFSVCGDGIKGLGVCFVFPYSGKLQNPENGETVCGDYVVYVRAFSGTHSREPKIVLQKHAKLVRYDLPCRTFMADAEEWCVENGEIVRARKK